MALLLLARHAQAEHASGVPDHDRPLSGRGRRDAAATGAFLAERGLLPGLVISSTAVRALETARLIAGSTTPPGRVTASPALYGASVDEALEAAAAIPADAVLLVGHNPTMSRAVETLTGSSIALVTAAVACVEVPALSRAHPGSGVLRWMLTPHLVRGADG